MNFVDQISGLLGPSDPDPVEWENADSSAPIMLLCEHAGSAIPKCLGDLGLSETERQSHIGWDIGAEKLSRQISHNLSAPLILQRYSRLVIDCNRPPTEFGSIPVVSDGVEVAGNKDCTPEEELARRQDIFDPLDQAISVCLDQFERKLLISIHSFTPQMGGQRRPWNAGFLSRHDLGTAHRLMAHIQELKPDYMLAINEPYSIDEKSDWFIPQYAEKLNAAHTLIEIRNDQLLSQEGIDIWAELISSALGEILEQFN